MTALPRLQRPVALVDSDGKPGLTFQRWWDLLATAVEGRVLKDQAAFPTYAGYAGQTVSNPPTQAEVQALDDAVKTLADAFVALGVALQTADVLT